MALKSFLISCAIEFGPITLFFFGTEFVGFFVGTILLVVGTAAALATSLVRDKRIPLFSLISGGSVLVFGISTLSLRDPVWLMIEYALYNGAFALVLLVGSALNKPLLKPLFINMFQITDRGWYILSLRWGLFFLLVALTNWYVWYTYTDDQWVFYRLLATVLLSLFGFTQFFLTRKERLPHASPWGLRL